MARFFGAGKEKPNLKQLGLYAVLSYGFVSNASYSICVGLAWFASSKKTGVLSTNRSPCPSPFWVMGAGGCCWCCVGGGDGDDSGGDSVVVVMVLVVAVMMGLAILMLLVVLVLVLLIVLMNEEYL